MAKFTQNHDKLYFDRLCRTQKGESVLSLIHATYQAKKNNQDNCKEEIAKKLVQAYELFKGDSGSYVGDYSQFQSQYTIGHELCIWANSDLDLTPLAIEVAENRITIRDYFDIVFLNYIQPINGNIVHILYHLLDYMVSTDKKVVTKDEMAEIYMKVGKANEKGDVNGAYNMLIASNYFKPGDAKSLVYCGKKSIAELKNACNTKYVDLDYEVVKHELATEEAYIAYTLSDRRLDDENEDKLEDRVTGGENILFYGVPGAGKSHAIKLIVGDAHYERVVFHPDFTYSDFDGQILPRVKKNEDGDDRLTYEFVEGPFTKALKYAQKHPNEMSYLVIEEINRGNAPAIFGDIFQLLDRDENGNSDYGITNYDIAKALGFEDEDNTIKIPSNLTLLATMNTSDQNVFTLDTAFQRRWNMHHIKNEVDKAEHANKQIVGSKVTWRGFANAINGTIVEYSAEMASSEDKQLGAYFVRGNELTPQAFPEKSLKYLWDDAFKLDRERVFDDEIKSIDDLIDGYNDAIKNNDDPIKRVMRTEVYNRMMDMSANSVEEAIAEEEDYEAYKPEGEAN